MQYMEKLGLLGVAAAFFAVGFVLLFYELSRIKAGRPILNGGIAAQGYYIIYLAMFVLALIFALKAIIV
jgi:divalent metal cation (Fe/Co/Zn/Cd) transporter